jgi:hypothetical protein
LTITLAATRLETDLRKLAAKGWRPLLLAAASWRAFLNGRFDARGVPPRYPLTAGLLLGAASTTLLLAMTLAGWMPLPLVITLLVLGRAALSPHSSTDARRSR